jgi:hypothetical protein
METGIPLKNGLGWVSRWTRATFQDILDQAAAIAEKYREVEIGSRALPPEEQGAYRFEQMRQFRSEYRQQFLESRGR